MGEPRWSREQVDGQAELGAERWELLRQLDELLDGPMVVLSFVWLGLTIVDFTTGLGPVLLAVSHLIWALFGLQFLIGLAIAPSRLAYIRHNWITAVALVLPAFRILRAFRAFRLLRAARAVRSVSLLRLFTTLNRGARAVNGVIGHRGLGYVVVLTTLVTFAGAAGMAQFESPEAVGAAGAGLDGYAEALWWTAMLMTTMGSEYWPRTLEGRILGWVLALYAFTVFGYITATIASLFLSRDAAVASAGAGAAPAAGLVTEAATSAGTSPSTIADGAVGTATGAGGETGAASGAGTVGGGRAAGGDGMSGASGGAARAPADRASSELAALRHEVAALRAQVAALHEALGLPSAERRDSSVEVRA